MHATYVDIWSAEEPSSCTTSPSGTAVLVPMEMSVGFPRELGALKEMSCPLRSWPFAGCSKVSLEALPLLDCCHMKSELSLAYKFTFASFSSLIAEILSSRPHCQNAVVSMMLLPLLLCCSVDITRKMCTLLACIHYSPCRVAARVNESGVANGGQWLYLNTR